MRPLHVAGIRRVDLARPVVVEPDSLQLFAEAINILLRREAGVLASLNRILLGGQSERVPAHRVQHVETTHPLVPRNNVRRRVALGMADVQAAPAGVREHVEDVVFWTRGIEA